MAIQRQPKNPLHLAPLQQLRATPTGVEYYLLQILLPRSSHEELEGVPQGLTYGVTSRFGRSDWHQPSP
jgi:hypothetical protein